MNSAQNAVNNTDRSAMYLDATDLRILEQLQADASLSNVELARRVHL